MAHITCGTCYRIWDCPLWLGPHGGPIVDIHQAESIRQPQSVYNFASPPIRDSSMFEYGLRNLATLSTSTDKYILSVFYQKHISTTICSYMCRVQILSSLSCLHIPSPNSCFTLIYINIGNGQ